MMKEKAVSAAGIITSILAAACCIGPPIFLAFGITGVELFSRVEWLRPYLILVTFILVGFSYRYAYGKRVCQGGNCGLPARSVNRVLFWVLVIFAAFGVAFPYLNAWLLV